MLIAFRDILQYFVKFFIGEFFGFGLFCDFLLYVVMFVFVILVDVGVSLKFWCWKISANLVKPSSVDSDNFGPGNGVFFLRVLTIQLQCV